MTHQELKDKLKAIMGKYQITMNTVEFEHWIGCEKKLEEHEAIN